MLYNWGRPGKRGVSSLGNYRPGENSGHIHAPTAIYALEVGGISPDVGDGFGVKGCRDSKGWHSGCFDLYRFFGSCWGISLRGNDTDSLPHRSIFFQGSISVNIPPLENLT